MTRDRRVRFWLESPGARVPVSDDSALLGRSVDCDIVLADARVSRHHAIVRAVEGGFEAVALGGPITRNHVLVEGTARFSDGDELGVFDHRFVLRSAPTTPEEPSSLWFIERDRGLLIPIGDGRFVVGGAADGRLVIPGWAPEVVALERVGERLVAEVLVDGVTIDGERHPGDVLDVPSGASVAHRAVSLRVVALPTSPTAPTHRPPVDELPTELSLALLPRGGRLTITIGPRVLRVYLADKRCELVSCLVQPPLPYAAGDHIPDEVISARLWPAGQGNRTDINTLVWRIRKDLASASLDGVPLLDRSNGGLSLRLAAGARVSIS